MSLRLLQGMIVMMYFTRLFICTVLIGNCTGLFAGPLALYLQKEQEQLRPLIAANTIHREDFRQPIDHNNPASGLFSQRYYVDETFGPAEDAPVFFYICGESSCTKRSLNGAIRQYAQRHHAKLVALEHRFYGESLPMYSFATEALQYLSTDIALEDLAYFQQQITQANHWSGKWVAFGGSYPGSLSAYYRLIHPELVVGALASSAPVMAKEDFFEYDAHVNQVAGPVCAAHMRTVVQQVEATLEKPAQLARMKALFEADEVIDSTDFLYLIADVGASAVQYGMKDTFCTYLNSSETPLIGYAEFAKYLYKRLNVKAVDITVQGAMSENPRDYPDGIGMRQWYYQSCKEYGYWQNANPDQTQSTRSALINLDYHHRICQRLFGLKNPADTEALNTHLYFPLMEPSSTNIFFTNGEQDPWSMLSMTDKNGNTSNAAHTYYLIKGSAHCDDLRKPTALDSEYLIAARSTMNGLLDKWLH